MPGAGGPAQRPDRGQIKPKPGTDDPDPYTHPAIQAGILHHRLVWIHPFVDGNGRTTRMFTTLLLYQRGYDFKYLFELSSYYNTTDRSSEL